MCRLPLVLYDLEAEVGPPLPGDTGLVPVWSEYNLIKYEKL